MRIDKIIIAVQSNNQTPILTLISDWLLLVRKVLQLPRKVRSRKVQLSRVRNDKKNTVGGLN